MYKLLLVGNDSFIRQGLSMRLAFESDFKIIGAVDSGEEALLQIQNLRPDVVVMDEVMPSQHLFKTITSLREAQDQCAIILLSLYDDEKIRAQADLAGVDALVGKREGVEVLVDTIRQAIRP
jgi:two-component system, NarL family, response regulator DegU